MPHSTCHDVTVTHNCGLSALFCPILCVLAKHLPVGLGGSSRT
jgi:hypothetical protein